MKTAVCGTVVVGVACSGLDGFSLLAIVYVSVDQVVLYLPRHGEFRRPSPLWQGVYAMQQLQHFAEICSVVGAIQGESSAAVCRKRLTFAV